MTTKHIFVLETLVAGLFGIGLIALPNDALGVFGIADPGDVAQSLLARFLGGALIGIGATEWASQNEIAS